jgi:hypothetical protein
LTLRKSHFVAGNLVSRVKQKLVLIFRIAQKILGKSVWQICCYCSRVDDSSSLRIFIICPVGECEQKMDAENNYVDGRYHGSQKKDHTPQSIIQSTKTLANEHPCKGQLTVCDSTAVVRTFLQYYGEVVGLRAQRLVVLLAVAVILSWL